MARTVEEIYNQIITAKESESDLDGLTPLPDTYQNLLTDIDSSSKVSKWRRWARITAYCQWALEKLFDLHKKEVDDTIANLIPLSIPWYRDQMFSWQYGDALAYLNGKYKYTTIDASKQIVKRASVTESGNTVLIKVAKLNGTDPEKLSTAEFNGLQSYLKKIRGGGARTLLRSEDADLLKLSMEIHYNAALINSDGENILSGDKVVEDAITAFIKELPFDGVFRKIKLIDAIQAVEGVIDVKVTTIQAKYSATEYEDIDLTYRAFSGYLKIDPAHTLTDNLTYIIA